MKQQIKLYTGEYAEIGGVRVKCTKALQHRQGGGPPRFGVVLEYDEEAQQPAVEPSDEESSENENADSDN